MGREEEIYLTNTNKKLLLDNMVREKMKVAVRDQTKSNKGQCSAPEIYLSGSQNSIQLIFLVKITFKTLMGTKSPQFIFCVKTVINCSGEQKGKCEDITKF